MLERASAEELTDYLGYEIGDPAGSGVWQQPQRLHREEAVTEAGAVDLEVPRDRNGTHEPQIVRKGGSVAWTGSTRCGSGAAPTA